MAIIADGFFEPNISSVAAPVFSQDGQVVAALGITVPESRIPESQRETLVNKIVAAANHLSECLGSSQSAARQAG